MAYSGMHLSFWKFYFNISIHPLSPFYFADIPSVIASFRHTWGMACLLFWPYSCSGVRRQTDLVQTKKATNWPWPRITDSDLNKETLTFLLLRQLGDKLTLSSNITKLTLTLLLFKQLGDRLTLTNKPWLFLTLPNDPDIVFGQATRRQTYLDKQTLIVLVRTTRWQTDLDIVLVQATRRQTDCDFYKCFDINRCSQHSNIIKGKPTANLLKIKIDVYTLFFQKKIVMFVKCIIWCL